jgi:hypothetical protein
MMNRPKIRSSSVVLAAPVAQDYCWMWTNKTALPAGLAVELGR